MLFQSSNMHSSLEDEKAKEDIPSSSHSDYPDEAEPSDDLSKPRKVHYHSKWKLRQDAVYSISLARAHDKRTAVLANQIPCHNCFQLCDGRLHLQSDFSKTVWRLLFERLSTLRPAPKKVLKSAWQSQQRQDRLESVFFGHQEIGAKRGTRYSNRQSRTTLHQGIDAKYWVTCWEREAWL